MSCKGCIAYCPLICLTFAIIYNLGFCDDVSYPQCVTVNDTTPMDFSNFTWSDWGPWSACSTTCNDTTLGYKKRTRNCTNNMACQGKLFEVEPCDSILPACPKWGAWAAWSNCQTLPGILMEVKKRTRTCRTATDSGDLALTDCGDASESEAYLVC